MASRQPPTSKRPARQAQRGRDGLTLGQRLQRAMRQHNPPWNEAALLAVCDKIAKDQLSQQLLNQILTNKNSRSAAVPLMAEALGVRAVWLQLGIGEMKEIAPGGRGPMSHQDRADRAFMQAFRELPKEWEFTIRGIVSTLAVAMRDSHGEFAERARAATAELLEQNGFAHHD